MQLGLVLTGFSLLNYMKAENDSKLLIELQKSMPGVLFAYLCYYYGRFALTVKRKTAEAMRKAECIACVWDRVVCECFPYGESFICIYRTQVCSHTKLHDGVEEKS